jgi:hypothetical protein
MVPLIRVSTNYPIVTSFNQSVSTNGQNYLSNLTINFLISTCVSGIVFGYNDGTVVTTGYTFDHQLTLDMTNKHLTAVNSYCGAIADVIQFCAKDLSSSSNATCILTGNQGAPTSFLDTTSFNIGSYYGDYYNYAGWLCLLNLGVNLAPCKLD